ncbi:MAG: DUF5330 domain-containing protein [Pseudomonadota bacterium]
MRFLIKTAFWLCLILVFLPIDRQVDGIDQGPGALETMAALQATVQDLRGFCERNADVCATGAANMETLRQKAAYSVDLLQVWLDSERVEHAFPAGENAPVVDADGLALLVEKVTVGRSSP